MYFLLVFWVVDVVETYFHFLFAYKYGYSIVDCAPKALLCWRRKELRILAAETKQGTKRRNKLFILIHLQQTCKLILPRIQYSNNAVSLRHTFPYSLRWGMFFLPFCALKKKKRSLLVVSCCESIFPEKKKGKGSRLLFSNLKERYVFQALSLADNLR